MHTHERTGEAADRRGRRYYSLRASCVFAQTRRGSGPLFLGVSSIMRAWSNMRVLVTFNSVELSTIVPSYTSQSRVHTHPQPHVRPHAHTQAQQHRQRHTAAHERLRRHEPMASYERPAPRPLARASRAAGRRNSRFSSSAWLRRGRSRTSETGKPARSAAARSHSAFGTRTESSGPPSLGSARVVLGGCAAVSGEYSGSATFARLGVEENDGAANA